jgi:hypothetical protein
MITLTVEPLTEFFDAIRNSITKGRYEKRLDLFFRYMGIDGSTLQDRARSFTTKAKDPQWATHVINDYMRHQKERAERGEISESTLMNFYKPIKLFCEMNDIMLNWKKISKRIPKGRQYGQDRAPSINEIKAILAYPDRRIKPVILVMGSSGIRLGSFDYLDWGHITPIERDGQVIAAKVKVYAGTDEEYFTYITPEAYNVLKEYMQYRESHGENIRPDSPVIRDLFHPDRGGQGEPHIPKRLKSTGVKRIIEDALKATGLRKALEGKRRHEFQAAHGFRKWFKSICEKHMKTLHVEMLLGHDTGLNMNYYRPPESELLDDYLKAVPDLTILEEVKPAFELQDVRERLAKLEEENKALTERLKEYRELAEEIRQVLPLSKELSKKAKEKDMEIQALKRQLRSIMESLQKDKGEV